MPLQHLQPLGEKLVGTCIHRLPSPCMLRSNFRQAWEENLGSLRELGASVPSQSEPEKKHDQPASEAPNISTLPSAVNPDSASGAGPSREACAQNFEPDTLTEARPEPETSLSHAENSDNEEAPAPSGNPLETPVAAQDAAEPVTGVEGKDQFHDSSGDTAPIFAAGIASPAGGAVRPEAKSPEVDHVAEIRPRPPFGNLREYAELGQNQELGQVPSNAAAGDLSSLSEPAQPENPGSSTTQSTLPPDRRWQTASLPQVNSRGPSETAGLQLSGEMSTATGRKSEGTSAGPWPNSAQAKQKLADKPDHEPKTWWVFRLLNRDGRTAPSTRGGKLSATEDLASGGHQARMPVTLASSQATQPKQGAGWSLASNIAASDSTVPSPPAVGAPPPTLLSFPASQPINDVAYRQGESPGIGTMPPASPWGDGEVVDTTDRTRFINRVAQAVAAGLRRDGTLRLKLHPPELGVLRLQLRWKTGRVAARLEADNPEACTLLTEALTGLRQRLETQQIRVEKLEVVLTNSGETAGDKNPSGQATYSQPAWSANTQFYKQPSPETRTIETGGSQGIIDQYRVDIRI